MDQPDGAEDRQHGGSAAASRDEAAEPGDLGDHRQILQQHRGDALVVVGVSNGEGDSASSCRLGVVLADADDLAIGFGDESDVLGRCR